MKSFFGQYAKVVILVLAVFPLLMFMTSGDFKSRLPKDDHLSTHVAAQNDNGAIVDDIAAREKPVITITKKKLNTKEKVNFLNYAVPSFQDANAKDQRVMIKKIVFDDKNPATPDIVYEGSGIPQSITTQNGTYKVTYRAEETYKGTVLFTETTAQFVAG